MIHWRDVTPEWAQQGHGTARWFASLGMRRYDASIDGRASRIRLTIEPDGAATLEVGDADDLRNPEVLRWVAERVVSPPESTGGASHD